MPSHPFCLCSLVPCAVVSVRLMCCFALVCCPGVGWVQAATTYAQLLNTQSDNNVKLIVLERLAGLKKHHAKVNSRNSMLPLLFYCYVIYE